MRHNSALASFVVCALTISTISGCGSDAKGPPKLPDSVPVTGTVTLDGQPLPDATVSFHPESEKGFQGALGKTDSSGKYDLATPVGNGGQAKGAIPGKYKVTVSRLIKPDGTAVPFDPNVPPMNLGAHESIPQVYSLPGMTLLAYEVPAGGGSYDIPIKSK